MLSEWLLAYQKHAHYLKVKTRLPSLLLSSVHVGRNEQGNSECTGGMWSLNMDKQANKEIK